MYRIIPIALQVYGTGMIVVSDELFDELSGISYALEVIDVEDRFENKG
jgi:putative ABC transport system permease protein